LLNGFERFQIGNERFQIFFRHARVGLVRHHGDKVVAVTSNSLNDGVVDLLVGPTAEPRFFVLGNIRAVNFSERNRKSASPGIEGSLRHGVTGTAASQRKDILTLLDKISAVLLGASIDGMD